VIPPLQFHHLDEHLLVVDKPAGLLAVPGRGEDKQDCLSARVQHIYPDALVVHRLDMATSGLMLMARNPSAQRILSLAFAERRVHKRYVAVVHGLMTAHLNTLADADGWCLIDLPIAVDWPNRPLRVINHGTGKPSQTRWRIQNHDAKAGTTRLLLEPLTGRSHQLRVHLLALGHPIVGDALYGLSLRAQRGNPSPSTADMDCRAALAMTGTAALAMTEGFEHRLRLHASALAFDHPVKGTALAFDSAVPF